MFREADTPDPKERPKRNIKRLSYVKLPIRPLSSAKLAVGFTFRLAFAVRKFVRDFAALTVVIGCVASVSLLNVRVGLAEGLVTGFWKSQETYVKPKTGAVATRNLALVDVPTASRPSEEGRPSLDREEILEATPAEAVASFAPEEADRANDKVIIYTVREGDTISSIAKAHKISIDTITWENEISDIDAIKPGDKLRLLAVSGLRYKIKSGDTVEKIASKYKVDASAILSFNDLPANGEITVGQEIIIPGGKKPEVKIAPRRTFASLGSRRIYTRVNRGWLTHPAPYAIRTQGLHRTNAVDLAGPYGSPIYAAAAGTVIKATSGGWGGGYGKYIMIRHSNGVVTLYAHASRILVKRGQKVKKGQVIARMGSTGRSTGSHVHFEVRGARNPF